MKSATEVQERDLSTGHRLIQHTGSLHLRGGTWVAAIQINIMGH